jgi:small-conductance mechanosensitive channel
MKNFISQLVAHEGFTSGIEWFIKLFAVLIIWRFVRVWINKFTEKLLENERGRVAAPIVKVCAPVIYAMCGVIFLFAAGVQGGLQALLTSSGIAAVVVGVACQDTIGNFISGLVLLLTRPFTIGDVIRYVDSDITGTVESVSFRHTIIRTFENKRLVIPNSQLCKAVLENYTSEDPSLCLIIDFGINYGQDAGNALSVLKDTISGIEGVMSCKANIDALSDSAVVLRARAVIPNITEQIRLKHEILLAVYRAFAESKISFAYPHITISDE